MRTRKGLTSFRVYLLAGVISLLMPPVGNRAVANLITNPSFETVESTDDSLPSTFGNWSGDYSAIVGAEQGISPRSGERMLEFIYTTDTVPSTYGASQVWQLADVSSYATEIAAGTAVASLSGYFNRVAGDVQTDTRFRIRVGAYSGVPADFSPAAALDWGVQLLLTDSDLGSWEQTSTTLLLPVETTYLAVEVAADENVYNDSVDPEFDGHYADDISLTVGAIPEPSTLVGLVGIGGMGLALYGWRRRRRRPTA